MADEQVKQDELVHEARVTKDAQDRAAIEVAEGVTVPRVATERGLFVAMSERAKPFLAKYGHTSLGDFLGAVGSDAQLAKRVIAELVEERFGTEPVAAAEPEPDPKIAELEGELEAARKTDAELRAGFEKIHDYVDQLEKSRDAFRVDMEKAEAALSEKHGELSEALKDLADLKAKLTATEAAAAAAADKQIPSGDDSQKDKGEPAAVETEAAAAETEAVAGETPEGEHAA